MLSNHGAGEDSWESFGLKGNQISQSWRKLTPNIHWMWWLDSIIDSMNKNLRKLWEILENWGAWHAPVHGVTKSWTQFSNWLITTINPVVSIITLNISGLNTPIKREITKEITLIYQSRSENKCQLYVYRKFTLNIKLHIYYRDKDIDSNSVQIKWE